MKKSHVISLLALLFVAGTLLRLYQLDNRSLWFDESFSWALSQFSLHELIDRTGQDVHPPFYYLILKAWTILFGTSVFAMRMLSVAFASLTLVGVYLLVETPFLIQIVSPHREKKSVWWQSPWLLSAQFRSDEPRKSACIRWEPRLPSSAVGFFCGR